jgi:hypothetical protein
MLLLGLLVSLPAAAKHTQRKATAGHTKHHHSLLHHKKKKHVVRGQRNIDPQRATEIQQALLREHYLSGDPSGVWDSETQAAMQKYQADNGWQTKITPDARALIKLGLGPKQDEGEYASTIPAPVSDSRETQPSGTSSTDMPITSGHSPGTEN